MKRPTKPLLSLIALACVAIAAHAADPEQQLPTVTVTGRSATAAINTSAFGETPNARLPMQALHIDAQRLSELGSLGLSALPMLDASVSSGYNSIGYIAQLKVRGFDLDTRFNLRRDGLPVNGETGFDLFNKAALELIKGTSGLQSGVSSPGGLLNLAVKRPEAAPRLDLSLGWESSQTWVSTLDASQRLSGDVALRINAVAARLDPWLRSAQGERQGLALAADWRLSPDSLLQAEAESTHQRQPSQPGFSLLGDRLPSAKEIDPRRNLNDPAWRLPVVFNNDFASLRLLQRLNDSWHLTLQGGLQRARTDDRVAFPFGCYDAATDIYYADRYCPNGNYDLYDFRSDNERRRSTAVRAMVEGRVHAAGLVHQVRAEVLSQRLRADFGRQAFNTAGTGNVFGGDTSTPDPALTDENTNRREHSQELALSDQVQWGAAEVFAGLRHTRLQRAAVRTDGSRPTDYAKSFTTPWLGLTWMLAPDLRLYASAGEGLETLVTPNRSRYSNAAEAFSLKSRQVELGVKSGNQTVDWSVAVFDIRRPAWRDIGTCDVDNSCERRIDGTARHRGFEAQADFKWSGGGLLASATVLHARRQSSSDTALNGIAPENVPKHSAKLALRQGIADGWQVTGQVLHEGPRGVLPDNSIQLPGWTRLDLGLRYEHALGPQTWRWRLGLDNALNTRGWQESPYQFSHSYLFPLAPRTWRAAVEVSL